MTDAAADRSIVAEQFDDGSFDETGQQREAATLGMWTFLATEVLFFGVLFMSYLAYRVVYPETFAEASHHTYVMLGGINTAVLLTSSLTMALAVGAAQAGRRKALVGWLIVTALIGTVFLGIKGYEYFREYQDHLVPAVNFSFDGPHPAQVEIFYYLYFVMTGLHAIHLTIGIGVVSVMAFLASRGHFSSEYHSPVENTGLYWHFVDIVWVFLFPIIYLVGGR